MTSSSTTQSASSPDPALDVDVAELLEALADEVKKDLDDDIEVIDSGTEFPSKIYTDDAVRKMFASATIRKEVPVEEQLAQMPFKITDLANFKNVRTLALGSAIVLADGDETTGFEAAPFIVIGLMSQSPATPGDRDRFAQEAIRTFPGVHESRLTMSEPLRIDSTPGYETRMDATSGKNNTKVTVVQWLRFGSGSSVLRIVGSAPRDQWEKAFPRFRAVRDGIQSRG